MSTLAFTYPYPRPIMAADSVVLSVIDGTLHVLLICRGHEPFEGSWALPGGFVNENEPLDVAAARELREETGLYAVKLAQIGTFGNPGRDPRGWAVSVVYVALIDATRHMVKADDDARDAQWFPVHALPPMAFDHSDILEYALNWVKERSCHEGMGAQALPDAFSNAAFEQMYAAVANIVPMESMMNRLLESPDQQGLRRFRDRSRVPI
ncbi:MAG: hypothetical protein AMXMBFR84_00770 [Candidatus Hydrogenedentota bacterium]